MLNTDDFKTQLIKRSFQFSRDIIGFVDSFPNKRSAWVISDQLIRSSTSIGANIVEAQAASSKKDFVNFLTHSLKSANETKYWLDLTEEFKTNSELKNNLRAEVEELSKVLGKSIVTLKNQL